MPETTSALKVKTQIPDPQDDFFHAVGDDPSWSESYYFYYFDPERNIGGITRMGFRTHDGWKDYMHIVYLEGRRIVFCYEREDMPKGDEELKVGGLSLDRTEPFKKWKVMFDGKGQDLEDGRVLITPKKDRPEGWLQYADVQMDIDFDATHDPLYMLGEHKDRGHFEQPGVCKGHITVNGERREFSGFGLRDKSWGPRPWTDPNKTSDKPAPLLGSGAASGLFTQWLTAIVNENLGFAMTINRRADGHIHCAGFLYKDGGYHQMEWGEVENIFENEDSLIHTGNRFHAKFENGYELKATGEVINLGPSKIPMPGGATLVNSGLTRFTLDSGETALGSSEYWISVTR